MLLIIGIILVLIYDFTNGFHDAADMVATAIASRSMTPAIAILIVTIFTFIGPFVGGVAVANTIGEFVDISKANAYIAQSVALSAICAAIFYNLITWKFGLPTSSSNSLTSGLVGAGLFALESNDIHWGITELFMGQLEGFMKIVVGMVISPLAGFIVGFLLIKIVLKLFSRLTMRSKPFLKYSQYASVSLLAFSHGTNDAQKGMGVIAMLLFASGTYEQFTVPIWVILLCASAITIGTMFGGWSIIKTVGFGIYKVKLVHSIADQLGASLIIFGSSLIGAPTSTTQVVTTTLMGVGAGERPKHVRWNMTKNIFTGWLMNIPTCIGLGYGICYLLNLFK